MKEIVENRDELFSLFETYGSLLSSTQNSILGDYLSYDLSISEIAGNRNITRSAVEDAIKKAEKKLREYEMKLGILKSRKKLIEAFNKGQVSGDYKELEELLHAI